MLFYELPFIDATHGGKTAISAAKQDVIKLTILAGQISTIARSFPIRVIDWKGQLPKRIVAKRVLRSILPYTPRTKTTHEIDAIGIGLYVIEKGFHEDPSQCCRQT